MCKCHKSHKKDGKKHHKDGKKDHKKDHKNKNPLGNAKVQLTKFEVDTNASRIPSVNASSTSTPDSIWVTGAPLFWKLGNAGENVIIGVIDTGIDSSHPVLKNKIAKKRNYVNDGASESQYNSHATHVAGTICADADNLKGVAPKAKIYDYRVLDKNGSGTYDNVTKAINDAANDGCHIINMSLGGPSSYAPMQKAIQNAVSKGVLVVVAAGNEGPGKISYPGYYPEVVSVGAVQFDSTTGNLTLPQTPWFSNTNPQVDLCADGWKVYSSIPNNQYATYSGTSMASPQIAGFAALLRNKLKTKLKRNPTENELYTTLRSYTVETSFTANLQGSGFATIFPELPKKSNNTWLLPSLNNAAP